MRDFRVILSTMITLKSLSDVLAPHHTERVTNLAEGDIVWITFKKKGYDILDVLKHPSP